MADSSGPGTLVAAGINDAHHFVSGWHERARDGRVPIPYRACGATGRIRIRRAATARRIHFLLSGPVGVAQRPLVGSVTVGGTTIPLLLRVDAWVLRTLDLPREHCGELLEIDFACDNPVVPDEHLRNGDGRTLGWYVSAVWQD